MSDPASNPDAREPQSAIAPAGDANRSPEPAPPVTPAPPVIPAPSAQPFADPTAAPRTSSSQRLQDPGASESERTYAMLIHLSLLLAGPAPVLSLVAPLIMWQVKKADSAFIDDHGREAVNFHISVLLYGLLSLPFVLLCGVGAVPLTAAYALGVIGIVLSSIASRKGEYYRYPMCLRFLK